MVAIAALAAPLPPPPKKRRGKRERRGVRALARARAGTQPQRRQEGKAQPGEAQSRASPGGGNGDDARIGFTDFRVARGLSGPEMLHGCPFLALAAKAAGDDPARTEADDMTALVAIMQKRRAAGIRRTTGFSNVEEPRMYESRRAAHSLRGFDKAGFLMPETLSRAASTALRVIAR